MEKNKDLLIEIGTEELPVGYIKPALRQLSNFLCDLFSSKELEYGEINSFATPRRLVVKINNLEERTSPEEETIKGPPKEIAFDDSGTPTKAAKGFAKKFRVEVEKLKNFKTEKGEYVGIEKKIPSQKSVEIISRKLPEIIKNYIFLRG